MTIKDFAASLRHRRWLMAALIAVLLVAAYGGAKLLLGQKVPAYRVVRSDLLQTIVASGRVETPQRVDIGSQITGTVAEIPVVEGQAVKAGQVLVVLDSREPRAALEQAHAAVLQAQARLRQIREVALPAAEQALQQANVNLQNAKRQFERTRNLHAQGFVGEAQLDDAQRNLDLAQSQVHTATLQLETNRLQGSDYHMAQAALQQAQANARMAQARLDYTSIAAPADGTLIARSVERGDVVQPGKVLMVLSPVGKTQLVVQIDEKNLSNLILGQKALASADAYPGQHFAAVLVYINPAVDPQRGSVEVKLDVPGPPAYLRQDMTVSVDITVARRSNALVVAADALHDSNGDAPWVMKVSKGRAMRQVVKLGIRGGGKVEIIDGLQEGDLVLSATGSRVAAGQRINKAQIVERNKAGQ